MCMQITIRTAVLRLPMHCNGCAKDIERSIYKMKGALIFFSTVVLSMYLFSQIWRALSVIQRLNDS